MQRDKNYTLASDQNRLANQAAYYTPSGKSYQNSNLETPPSKVGLVGKVSQSQPGIVSSKSYSSAKKTRQPSSSSQKRAETAGKQKVITAEPKPGKIFQFAGGSKERQESYDRYTTLLSQQQAKKEQEQKQQTKIKGVKLSTNMNQLQVNNFST